MLTPPVLRNSPAWQRAGLAPRFMKLADPVTPQAGCCGKVVKGWDTENDCYVAVKMSYKRRKESADTLVNEHRILQSIRHPSILLPIHLCSRDSDDPLKRRTYVVSAWIDGPTLGAGKLKEPLEPVMLGVLSGLACLHAHGIIHNDLKGQNIMREGTRAIIIDFGIATELSASNVYARRCSMAREVSDALKTLMAIAKKTEVRAIETLMESELIQDWKYGLLPTIDKITEHVSSCLALINNSCHNQASSKLLRPESTKSSDSNALLKSVRKIKSYLGGCTPP